MIRIEIVNIGSELLDGKTVNTNATDLCKWLARSNFQVHSQASVRDDLPIILKFLNSAWNRADCVIVTGGIGPTPDDVTREAISQFFELPLVIDRLHSKFVKAIYKNHARKYSKLVLKESMIPKTSIPLRNRHGIALGFAINQNGKLMIVLPGVPQEVRGMFEDNVLPLLKTRFKRGPRHTTFSCQLFGIDEPMVIERLGKGFFRHQMLTFGIYPANGILTIRLSSEDARILTRAKLQINAKLGRYIFSRDERSLEEIVGFLMRKKHRSLALAESCSGGMVAKKITDVSGASHFFRGAVVAYNNQVKMNLLGVSERTLIKYGAVSKECAREMALGVRKLLNASIGLSITGIAGPEGGSLKKPVGLVWIGIAFGQKTIANRHYISGDRHKIRLRASQCALMALLKCLNGSMSDA